MDALVALVAVAALPLILKLYVPPFAYANPGILVILDHATELALSATPAVLALPFNAAVIVPAIKLPLASLATIVFAVFALVASLVTVITPVVTSVLI